MKKVLSLVLAVVLALGMTTMAFAADKIEGYAKADIAKNELVKLVMMESDGSYTQDIKLSGADIVVGDGDSDDYLYEFSKYIYGSSGEASKYAVYIVAKLGDDDVATATDIEISGVSGKYRFITKSQVDKWDLAVSLSKASTTFKGISLRSKESDYKSTGTASGSFIRFELQTSLVSTASKTSKDTIKLTANDGKTVKNADIKIETVFKNKENKFEDDDETEIYADDETARYLNIKTYLSKVQIYTEYDGIITTRLYERKYYVEMSNTPGTTAIAVMDKYGFEDYRKLSHLNLPDSATVTFDLDDNLYVYGPAAGSSYDSVADSVQLVYLGRSNQQLPISADYYFSPKEITIETVKDPDTEPPAESSEPDAPASSTNPAGGPTEALPNNNYNPGTGC